MTRSLAVRSLLALALAVGASACGATSSAELKLMDAPPQGVTAVKVTVASMQVHVADADKAKDADPNDTSIDDDGGWQSLSVNKQIDLVQHQGETAAEVLGQLDLPEGKITQIRLVLDTSKPENNVATVNGTDCNLGVEKVAKKGIKINHPFKAFESKGGQKHEVLVDFKLDESLKDDKKGCYDLEPKIHLHKVKTDGKDLAL